MAHSNDYLIPAIGMKLLEVVDCFDVWEMCVE